MTKLWGSSSIDKKNVQNATKIPDMEESMLTKPIAHES